MFHNKSWSVNTKRLPISIDKGLNIIPNDYMALRTRKTRCLLADINLVYKRPYIDAAYSVDNI